MKTKHESIAEYKKKLEPLLRYPEFWEYCSKCIAYCDEYEKFSEDAMPLGDYITIKTGTGLEFKPRLPWKEQGKK
jgi:hypothetical protein